MSAYLYNQFEYTDIDGEKIEKIYILYKDNKDDKLYKQGSEEFNFPFYHGVSDGRLINCGNL